MYEDVLDDGALQAMWDEHPEAFHVDALQEEVDRLKEELDEARRQRDAYKSALETTGEVLALAKAITSSRLSVEP